MLAEFHLHSSGSANNLRTLDSSSYNHDGIVQAALSLINVLFSAASEEDGGAVGLTALFEDVVPFVTNLDFLKLPATAQSAGWHLMGSAKHCGASRFSYPVQIFLRHSACAEEGSVSEVLSGKVANGEFAQDDLSSSLDDALKLSVDDVPLCVDDALVVLRVADPDLSVLLLTSVFQLDVQQEDLRLVEALWLLLETSIAEGLLESNSINQEAVRNRASWDVLDAYQALVELGV
mmetsp:Transcript_25013/g.43898  ORF Transcript_25013/g.43898 Transcript_25013/m.43898 type:complete len:234 (-) Transcript_25013:551-1252(-)